jgi:galactokinase
MIEKALRTWADHFDGPPTVVSVAPGRVNLIGEHTDYNDGLVFPAAIERHVVVLARSSQEDDIRSAQIRDARDHRGPGWRRYAYAVRCALEDRGLHATPIEALVSSTVPSGSGLSSSAALEVAFAGAWNRLGSLGLSDMDIAGVAWQAENAHVGVRCGRMDQMASVFGKEGCAILMDMRSLECDAIRLPTNLQLAILDTRQSRALAGGIYNQRVQECQRAVAFLSKQHPTGSLRDAAIERLEEARQTGLDDSAFRRARHVLTENQRVIEFRDALRSSDFAALGDICDASHQSLREDFEVSSPRLDAMARAARNAPGCLAARMTGAGLGGCCVALVSTGSFEEFRSATRASYEMYGFPTPSIFATRASAGAYAEAYS